MFKLCPQVMEQTRMLCFKSVSVKRSLQSAVCVLHWPVLNSFLPRSGLFIDLQVIIMFMYVN